ncbi:YihY/virulence factor BrkB family protein [Aureimonas fodinaquatilis]|uniref:YihY/virulence factor BrkB family protein n=1 Tax=Aureimonas fodinaquatilis TaxID=2565783 RepID=A0A5B0DXG3_9HYPH|nr:YihY/virulence factor BrkB family protein [Aureimonas fodinaquatilis]KAA0971163.1 YihY/virulence factor BrkB family protein [Aureimonas fodinaquatilis]
MVKSLRFATNTSEETRRRASEPGRGRAARGPLSIPFAGWRDIASRLWVSFFEDRVMLIAAGATFYLLLALFPALAVFVSIYGIIADPATIAGHIEFLGRFLPPAGLELVNSQLEYLVSQNSSSLSIGFITGLLFALWSANNGIKTLFEAMNVAYGEQEQRSFVKLNLVAVCFTLGGMVIATVVFVALGVVPAVMAVLGASSLTDDLVSISRWPVVFALVILAISAIYRYGPSRTRAKWKWILFGAFLTTVTWLAATIGFSWYLQNIANYNAMYGSLGAVIGFMMWMWISSVIFVFGAEINAEMEHQTAMDTTSHGQKPLGERGARVADSLGMRVGGDREVKPEKPGLFARLRKKPSTP